MEYNLGRVVGDNAYELWLSEGNTGSLEDFFLAYRGEQGAAFTFDDYTDEQIKILQQPASEAAAKAEAATAAANEATSATNAATEVAMVAATSATNAATSATNAATSATNAATSATNAAEAASSAATSATDSAAALQAAEETRVSNETARISAEAQRVTSETARVEAEAGRVAIFNELLESLGNETLLISIGGVTSGVTATVTYSRVGVTQSFEGEQLSFEIPVNEYYTVTFSNLSGYITPAYTTTHKAEPNNERSIEVAYIEAEASTIYFDNAVAVSGNISGDVGVGAISEIRSKTKRCLCDTYPETGGVAICMLDDDDTTKFSDGSDAYLDGSMGDVMVYFPDVATLNERLDNDISRLSVAESVIEEGEYFPASLIAAYKTNIGADNRAYSISGVLPTSSVSQAAFSAAAALKGEGWSNITYDDHRLIAALFYAQYGNRNSQAVIGTGSLNYGSGLTGTTNSIGNADTDGNVTGRANNFMGIEAVTGWYYEWMDNVVVNNGVWTITSPYDGTVREVTGITTSGWITKMAFEDGGNFDVIPTEVGGSDSTYYADYISGSTASSRVVARSCNSTGTYGGVGFVNTLNDSSYTYAFYGSRLAFHGSITILDPEAFKALRAT